MKEIDSPHAPKAVGHYSQAMKVGSWVYCSGQISLHPKSNELLRFDGDVGKQTQQILKNLAAVLKEAGGNLCNVVKTTVYLTNINDYADMNIAYAKAFGDHYPARACVQVSRLPKGVQIEIDATAYLEGE
jgi:2-iminobutanoate/2-iminopropanoate deaminase